MNSLTRMVFSSFSVYCFSMLITFSWKTALKHTFNLSTSKSIWEHISTPSNFAGLDSLTSLLDISSFWAFLFLLYFKIMAWDLSISSFGFHDYASNNIPLVQIFFQCSKKTFHVSVCCDSGIIICKVMLS